MRYKDLLVSVVYQVSVASPDSLAIQASPVSVVRQVTPVSQV